MKISVLLPSSIVADAQGLSQKTFKLGLVGRALAIFRVDQVIIYNDGHPRGNSKLISLILKYLETPQYLRKILFPKTQLLRYAGDLPPLRTPHHPLRGEKERIGDIREGVVVEVSKRGSILELGLDKKGYLPEQARVGERVTVRLARFNEDFIVVERARPQEYWGYKVETAENLGEALNTCSGMLKVGTSRYGRPLSEVASAIVELAKQKGIALAFGGPYSGLFEICSKYSLDPQSCFDFIVNTVPKQGTATVRTEEALLITLGIFNLWLS